MGLRNIIKRKMPATFNAAEYETGRVLARLDELVGRSKDGEVLNRLDELSGRFKDEEVLNRLDELSGRFKDEEVLNRLDELSGQIQGEKILNQLSHISEQLHQITKRLETLERQDRQLSRRLDWAQDQEIRFTPKPVLRIELHVAETCNLNCRMCSHFSCIAKPEFLEPEILERDMRRLAELYDNGVQHIKLLGGEPLLNPKLPELCRIVRSYFPDTHLLILTNGTLLSKMEDSFWIACRETQAEIQCTEYPISFDYEAAAELVRRQGISYSRINNGEMTFQHMPLDLAGTRNPARSFKHCEHPNDGCISLYHGRLYTCSVAMNARHFEERYHVGVTLSPRDSIDIHAADSVWEIAEFLSKPIPFCRYCDVGGRTEGHKWGKTKHSIREWTLPCPEEDT